jgi:hypothetical protein
METKMTITIHPQTCKAHSVEPENYRDNLQNAISTHYNNVEVKIAHMAEITDGDFSRNSAICRASLKNLSESEMKIVYFTADRVFNELKNLT